MSRDQVRYLISQLIENGMLDKEGVLKGTIYKKGKRMEDGVKIFTRAMELGINLMKKGSNYLTTNSPYFPHIFPITAL